MLHKEDMNKYNTGHVSVPAQRTEGEFSQVAGATAKTVGGMVWKVVKTILCVALISGLLVFLSVASFVLSFRDTEPPDISALQLNYSSTIYLDGDDGQSTEYLSLYGMENRVRVSLDQIPDYMKTAQIAIEDHRFYEHSGVDWKGTMGAVFKLFTNTGGGGGSTLTQQLIKNVTQENQVSVLRKVKEIFTALNLEKKYSKDEILQAYLNVVNYGGQCQGVEAAANHYYDKSIGECSLAECALIAGITQNPWQYNPMIFPDDSKKRARVVLKRMLDLSNEGLLDDPRLISITQSEYDQAVAELEAMDFVGAESDDSEEAAAPDSEEKLWNWYIDTMFEDVVAALQEKYGYGYDYAVDLMYTSGMEIHCAMDLSFQTDMEKFFLNNPDMLPDDQAIELGFFMMDPYTGRVMAVIGSRGEKQGRRIFNYATDAARQSGSAIKPISPYAVGLNTGTISYGTVLKDQPIPNYFGEGSTDVGPQNFSREYEQFMNVDFAIEQSQNAPAAWLCKEVTPEACYDWLVNSLHFSTLTEADKDISPMALGGQSEGVTVRDMTAAFQIYANGGVYHKPMTFYYVKDHNGNVILDNRDDPGEQVMTPENATVMNKLLHRPIYGDWGTATPQLSAMDTEIYGKTGTTDSGNDLWFVGATPFCVAGIWNGYDYPSELSDSTTAKITWRAVIQHLLDNYDWSGKSWVLSENVYSATFCRSSGKLAGPNCYDTATGWYYQAQGIGTCNGGSDHIAGPKVSPSPSPSPSTEPSEGPSISPEPSAPVSPSPGVSSGLSSETSELPISSEPSSSLESSSSLSSTVETPEPPPPPTDPPVDEPTPPPEEESHAAPLDEPAGE